MVMRHYHRIKLDTINSVLEMYRDSPIIQGQLGSYIDSMMCELRLLRELEQSIKQEANQKRILSQLEEMEWSS